MGEGLRSALEERVVTAVRDGEEELVALVSDLVALDTTARNVGDPPRQEVELQELLERRLEAAGAETDLWEPEPTGTGNRFVPDGLDFAGRPQLAARLRGAGGGRSLLLNGHIDAVSAEPVDRWTSPPLKPEVRGGELFGRGACDMKGGLAGMLFALETVKRLGIELAGDVVWASNTDEESSGAGSYACAARGVRADAGLCAEPTAFDVWVACRGGVYFTVRTAGRAGHAELWHPHWRDGGPVNAIEKMGIVLEAVRALRDDWAVRDVNQHPYLRAPSILPTLISGGEWEVTYPSACRTVLAVQYLPGRVRGDEGGLPGVLEEVAAWVKAATDQDDWLAENPPEWEWDCDIVPAEVPDDHPIVSGTLQAAADIGRSGKIDGLDSWHDAAVFTRVAGTPTISFGPGDLRRAHAVDECVPVADLVDHAAAVALMLLRWCGVRE